MAILVSDSEGNDIFDDIRIVESSKKDVTNISRQDQLFSQGYHFEALSSQACLVEGLLLVYMYLKIKSGKVSISDKMVNGNKPSDKELLEKNKFSFGKTFSYLRKCFHDPSLERSIEKYIANRNLIIHRLSSTNDSFNFSDSYKDGREIAFKLYNFILTSTREHRINNP